LSDLLKQKPQARRRPRRLIKKTLKDAEIVQDANEDVGAPTLKNLSNFYIGSAKSAL
jgi:hypothetical protein